MPHGDPVFNLSAYLPENVAERYETLRVSIVDLLSKLGMVRSNNIAPSEGNFFALLLVIVLIYR
jgi:hypothetical protein